MPFFTGTPGEFKQISKFNPAQEQGFNTSLQQALSGLQQPLGQGYAPIAQQARSQFNQQTIPTLAERFSSMGGQGGQRSSAFPQMLGQAGAGLEEGLAAGQAQFGLQHQQLLQQLLGIGLTPQFETMYTPRQPSFIGNLLSSLAPGLGMGAGMSMPYMLTGQNPFGPQQQNQSQQPQQKSPADMAKQIAMAAAMFGGI